MVHRAVWLAVLAFLRPAEASARRLIAIAAHGLIVADARQSGPRSGASAKGKSGRASAFRLFDPRRKVGPRPQRTGGFGPNIRFMDGLDDDVPPETALPQMVSAASLQRRLAGLASALGDIPRQAQRLARAYRRQERPIRPLRPGRPPGYRTRGRGEIDDVLDDCHALALIALAEPVRGVA